MPAGTEKPQAAGPQAPAGAPPGRGWFVAAAAAYAAYLVWLIVTALGHRFR
jgi:hypothetical protein